MSREAERIAEIAARLAKATPGPWEAVDYNRGNDERDSWLGVIRGAFEILDERFQVGRVKYSALPSEENEANAALIANSPADLRFLLDRVSELEADARRLDWLEANCAALNGFDNEGSTIVWYTYEDAARETLRANIDSAISATTPETHE